MELAKELAEKGYEVTLYNRGKDDDQKNVVRQEEVNALNKSFVGKDSGTITFTTDLDKVTNNSVVHMVGGAGRAPNEDRDVLYPRNRPEQETISAIMENNEGVVFTSTTNPMDAVARETHILSVRENGRGSVVVGMGSSLDTYRLENAIMEELIAKGNNNNLRDIVKEKKEIAEELKPMQLDLKKLDKDSDKDSDEYEELSESIKEKLQVKWKLDDEFDEQTKGMRGGIKNAYMMGPHGATMSPVIENMTIDGKEHGFSPDELEAIVNKVRGTGSEINKIEGSSDFRQPAKQLAKLTDYVTGKKHGVVPAYVPNIAPEGQSGGSLIEFKETFEVAARLERLPDPGTDAEKAALKKNREGCCEGHEKHYGNVTVAPKASGVQIGS